MVLIVPITWLLLTFCFLNFSKLGFYDSSNYPNVD